ncbi:MAG: hypothetical protein K1X94_14970 [Sandaracinaceae bacterium]|nr:hypothetical protein [Sandaracinaceae bacterium]
MTDPVRFRSPAEIDSAYRTIVGAHSHEASLQGPPEEHASTGMAVAVGIEGAHAGVDLAEGVGLTHLAGAAGDAAIGLGATVTAPFIQLGVGLAEINHAWEEHDRRGTEVDHHQMRGALLYVLGRIPNPDRAEVAEQFGTHERDGARDAARWERTRPAAFEALRERTVASFEAGRTAALLGTLRGAALETAMQDPVFRLGYEETQGLRASDPAAFAAQAREARSLSQAVELGRAAAPLPG